MPDTQQSGAGEAAAESSQSAGPVGQGDYVVQEGDCVSSIAVRSGHFWQTIWDDPANAEVKQTRGDPNLLLPGDRLTVPEVREKSAPGGTEARHRFRRRGEPSKLRLRFSFRGEPRAGEPYRIDIDGGETIEGTLDAEGKLEESIPGSAQKARVFVGEAGEEERYDISLGCVDPVSQLRGVQQRLTNIGYNCPLEDELGSATRGAIRAFQKAKGLGETGEPDEATQQALVEAHGS